MSANIHKTAIIDPTSKIGKNVAIGPYCVIGPNNKIKDNAWIQSNVRIDRNTSIGKGCRIYHGASIGNDPQDVKYNGEETTLDIGSGTVIREFVTIHRGTTSRGKTSIGKDCNLLNYVHVPHDCIVGNNVIMSNAAQIGGHAEIGDYAIIGGITGVHQFCRIGSHSMVGFGLRITQDVPPYILAAGEPVKASGINRIGLERRGFTNDVIDSIKKAYNLVYRKNHMLKKSLRKIREELADSSEAQAFADFIEKSERGIIR